MHLTLTLFTDDPGLAVAADAAGIERIGPDLESLNKAARQRGLATRLSSHRRAALPAVGAVLDRARLFVRINPIHSDSPREVEHVLAHGAGVVMLPFYRTLGEVRTFLRLVGGAATTVLLAETEAALDIMPAVLEEEALDEIHFGLTDLSIDLGVADRFGILRDSRFLRAVEQVRRAGVPFGIAGVARMDDRTLPVDPRAVGETIVHAGATRTLVSRAFLREPEPTTHLARDVTALRRWHAGVSASATAIAT